jgi:hypothetical protein
MNRLTNNKVAEANGFRIGNLIKKIGKTNGTIAIAFLALVLGACDTDDKIGEVKPLGESTEATNTGDTTTAQVPGTAATTGTPGAAVPGADATDSKSKFAGSSLEQLVGETVTVSTKVKEIVGPKAFIVYDKESLRGEKVLVVINQDAPAVGTNIEVTGDIKTFDAAVIKRDYDLDFKPDLVKVYENKPYLAARAMEKVD